MILKKKKKDTKDTFLKKYLKKNLCTIKWEKVNLKKNSHRTILEATWRDESVKFLVSLKKL